MLLAVLLAGGLVACSGSEEDDGDSKDNPSGAAADEAALVLRTGKVTGVLNKKRHRRITKDVGSVVDTWLHAAYLDGKYPRKRIGKAWPTFSKSLTRQAKHDRRVTSNAAIARRVDGIEAVRRTVRVDVLSPKGHPAGATARVLLIYDTTGDLEKRFMVRGRVDLVPRAKKSWRIIGYDLSRAVRKAKEAKGK